MKQSYLTIIRDRRMFLVLSAVFAVMLAVSSPAHGFSTDLITNSYSGDTADLSYAEANNGDMVIYASESDASVVVWTYDMSDDAWSDEIELTSVSVDGAASQSLYDLSIVEAPNHWLAVWAVDYMDINGNFLGTEYHTAHFNRAGEDLDAEAPSDIADAILTEGEGKIFAVPTSNGKYDDAYILWVDASDTVQVMGYYGTVDSYTTAQTFSDVYDINNLHTATVADSLYLIYRADNLTLQIARFTNEFLNDLVIDFQRTISDDYDSEALAATIGSDEEVFVVYKKDRELKRVEVNQDASLGDREIIFRNMPSDLNADNVMATYNDYGEGQYDIAVHHGRKLSVAHWSVQKGWTKEKNFFSGKASQLDTPKVRTFSNGKIQVLWKYKSKWWLKQYVSDDKAWSDNTRLRKNYGSLILRSPFRQAAVNSTDDTKSIELFAKKTGSKRQQVKKWKLGETFDDTSISKLPLSQKLVYIAQKGDYYFLVMKRGTKLRSAVLTDNQLFN